MPEKFGEGKSIPEPEGEAKEFVDAPIGPKSREAGDILDSIRKAKEREIKDLEWNVIESDLEGYGSAFADTLPKGLRSSEGFKRYIESKLAEKPGAVAVDFGGSGYRLFSGFKPGTFKTTVGVCLDEIIKEEIQQMIKAGKLPSLPGHHILIGNILDNKTYAELKRTIQGKKIDIIISKMEGGLEAGLPQKNREKVAMMLLRRWYRLLSEDGEMFIQFFTEQYNVGGQYGGYGVVGFKELREYLQFLKQRYPSLELKEGWGCLRLKRNADCPAILK